MTARKALELAAATEIISDEELARGLALAAQPIDFEALVAAGVLRRHGRNEWDVLDWDRLPEHASFKIRTLSVKPGTKTARVTFEREWPRVRKAKAGTAAPA